MKIGSNIINNLGWIKGVNSNTLNENNDPGKDGNNAITNNPNKNFARDVYGYSLGYFANDYQSIDVSNHGMNSFTASISGSDMEANRNDLFNGNIGSMITTITNPVTRDILPLGNAYKYDQLNRLLQAVSYHNLDLNISSGTFNSFGTGGTQMYYNAFTYDANGNILTQWRKDHLNNEIDSLHYKYAKDANGKIIQNRLYHVKDRTDYDGNDIDDMGAFDPDLDNINLNNNYSYNKIGELIRDKQEDIETIIWRPDGKIKEIIRPISSQKKNLKFDYDAFGRRIAKHVYETDNITLIRSTYYVRDAQENVYATYIHEVNNDSSTLSYTLIERQILGASRIGMIIEKVDMLTINNSTECYERIKGLKNYELCNHLGNVLAVISDKKIPIESTTAIGEVEYFITEIHSASDYSSFGVSLENRDFTSEKYRYGFNGMERDNEIKGNGNSYDYKMRFLDTRLGRFLSLDSYKSQYPFYSPYQFAGNKPIIAIDRNGKQEYIIIKYEQNGQLKGMIIVHLDLSDYKVDDFYAESRLIQQDIESAKQAIALYKSSKTSGWKDKVKKLEAQVVDMEKAKIVADSEAEAKEKDQIAEIQERYKKTLYITRTTDYPTSRASDIALSIKNDPGNQSGTLTEMSTIDHQIIHFGAPEVAKIEQKSVVADFNSGIAVGLLIDVPDKMSVNFESGSSQLSDQEQKDLYNLYITLTLLPHLKVQLVGHTDSDGTDAANMQLSTDRANAAKDYLLKLGISADRISTSGKGETQPISTNDTEEGKAANRRIEIIQVTE